MSPIGHDGSSGKKSPSRARYVDGAIRLFVEGGYSGTSVDDIAKSLGVTKGALYFHFKDKAALLEECLIEVDKQILHPLISRMDELENYGSRLDTFIYWWASIASVSPYRLMLPILMSVEFSNTDTEAARYLESRYNQIYALILEKILPPPAAEDEKALNDAKAMALVAITDGMLLEWHRRGHTKDGALTAKTVRNILRVGLGMSREASPSYNSNVELGK